MVKGEIRQKLDIFIRKYYRNELLKGALLSTALLLGLFLFVSVGEYFARFGTLTRQILFYGYLSVFAGIIGYYVIRPLLAFYNMGKTISYKQAAEIIGTHFSNVKDKLLNLLQLEEMNVGNAAGGSLLLAGIEQKTNELRPVPFNQAINKEANKKYLQFASIPVLLMGVILLFQSSIIKDGAQRLIQYNTVFKEKAPFNFLLQNRSNKIPRGTDYEVKLKISGNSLPEEVYIHFKSQKIKLIKNEQGLYTFSIPNVQQAESFYFSAADFNSETYKIDIMPVPAMSLAYLDVQYPAYLNKPSERLENLNELSVPEGSIITWHLKTKDADKLQIIQGNTAQWLTTENQNEFVIQRKIMQTMALKMLIKNAQITSKDTLSYAVQSIPDAFPAIQLEKKDDSTNMRQFYLLGNATDDYGINRVNLVYRFKYSNQPAKMAQPAKVIPMLIQPSRDVIYGFTLNMDYLGMAPSDEVEYYMEAWDNDGVHGSKVTKTQAQILRKESVAEMRQLADATGNAMKNNMNKAMKDAQDLLKMNKSVQSGINSSKNINTFEQKQKIEDLLKKQKELNKNLDDLQKENEKLNQQKEDFQPKDEKLLEQQKKLEELFKMLQNPDIQKMLEKLQQLMDKQLNPEDLKKDLEKMEKFDQDLMKEMDKLKEQFKRMEVEQKMLDNIQQLKDLAEKQEKLAQATENKEKSKEELQKEQQKLNKELEELKKDVKELDNLNKNLEKPMDLNMGNEELNAAESEMQQSEENIQNGQNKKASSNQKKAAENMKKAADKMSESMEKENKKQIEEDYATLRQILENLVDASIEQEDVFTELSNTREISPKVLDLNKRQMKLKEQCAMIEDSLWALAKRQPMLNSYVTKEIKRINDNMTLALNELKIRNLGSASANEQYVMTGLNNLAVMLMESLQNMQQQMNKSQKKGSGQCKNPGGNGKGKSGKGKPGSNGKLSDAQKQLGMMLQEMQKKGGAGMPLPGGNNGKESGEGKDGKSGKEGKDGKQGNKGLNKEFAQMALMQEALRKQLDDLKKKLEKEGKMNGELGKQIQETQELMNKQEKDLVNKKLTPEMIKRQKEIETRLLEHEKAELTQDTEEKRESQKPSAVMPTVPPALQEYIKQKKLEREVLRKTSPEFTPYFRRKVDEYLQHVR